MEAEVSASTIACGDRARSVPVVGARGSSPLWQLAHAASKSLAPSGGAGSAGCARPAERTIAAADIVPKALKVFRCSGRAARLLFSVKALVARLFRITTGPLRSHPTAQACAGDPATAPQRGCRV